MSTLEHLYTINRNEINNRIISRKNSLKQRAQKARDIRHKLLHKYTKMIHTEDGDDNEDDDNEDDYNEDNDEHEDDNIEQSILECDSDSDSESDYEEYDDLEKIVILPSYMNWYTCGYEHVLKSIQGKLEVFDISVIPEDIERKLQYVKEIYFLRKIPDIFITNQGLKCLNNKKIILIPGCDGFATFSFIINEVICIKPHIYDWATQIFEDDITITKMYSRSNIIPNPRTFSQHNVLFLHIMDGFISQTDVVINAWLDKKIKLLNPYPQLLILAEFSQFYQMFQIFRYNLDRITGGRTPHIEFKEFYKVRNRNIYISFHNYSFEELELISKSVSFMVQPGSSEVKKLAKKWNVGLISQDNPNGFELKPKFIDYNLICRRRRMELYVSHGDQQYPHKYTNHFKLLRRIKQASQYVEYKRT